ncbi:YxeA family protein [Bacillus thuringiensis]|nr:YxeA family protein [Bacillus thuringiensis]
MKRYIALFSILVVFASLLVGCDLNRMGKDEYYVQITVDGKEFDSKASNGQKFKDYEYKLTGFDKDGKEKELEFIAQKIFVKKHSYAYTTQIKRCNSLGRSEKDELPAKVKEKLSVK